MDHSLPCQRKREAAAEASLPLIWRWFLRGCAWPTGRSQSAEFYGSMLYQLAVNCFKTKKFGAWLIYFALDDDSGSLTRTLDTLEFLEVRRYCTQRFFGRKQFFRHATKADCIQRRDCQVSERRYNVRSSMIGKEASLDATRFADCTHVLSFIS